MGRSLLLWCAARTAGDAGRSRDVAAPYAQTAPGSSAREVAREPGLSGPDGLASDVLVFSSEASDWGARVFQDPQPIVNISTTLM